MERTTSPLNNSQFLGRNLEGRLLVDVQVSLQHFTGHSSEPLVQRNIHELLRGEGFKEDQIRRMRPGQTVEIAVDALHGRKFKGHIDSIQAGSGARFSLLPPENATGNYVKVVQRVPVKILFDEPFNSETGLPLGPGESVLPTVKVQDFHYSGFRLLLAAASTGAAVLGVLWWGTRPSKPKKNT